MDEVLLQESETLALYPSSAAFPFDISAILDLVIAIVGKSHEIRTTALALKHIAYGLP